MVLTAPVYYHFDNVSCSHATCHQDILNFEQVVIATVKSNGYREAFIYSDVVIDSSIPSSATVQQQ